MALLLLLCLGLAILLTARTALRLFGSARSLPPGPKGLPLVGNVFDLPRPGIFEAHHWLKHKDMYGPISSVVFPGRALVIINDASLAFELLEKRSAKHSSRPKQVFAGEMIGWENSLGLMPYNKRFRIYRKNIGRILGSKTTAGQYNALQEAEVGHFLLRMLDNPHGLLNHVKKEAASIILKIAYGYTAEPFIDDALIRIVGEAVENFVRAAVPGAFMVDILPSLRYLPGWVPGTGFKKTAREWRAALTEVTEKPYAFVKHQMAQGKDNTSFLSRLLEAGDEDPEQRFTNKWSAQSLYAAGADTTVSSITCFFLAMILSPDAQKKAQQEIDRVVGQDRLPTVADRERLPYVEALLKEVLRWHPVAPMGIPHMSTEDDVVGEYFIPKGSILMANIWHFTHDPDVYKDPMSFKPERFIATDDSEPEPDPRSVVFGFGRRICPGRILADNSLYLNIAQTLAVFNISKRIEDGRDAEPVVHFTPGVVSYPEPYSADVKPRTSHHERLIRSIEKTNPWQKSDAGVFENMDY